MQVFAILWTRGDSVIRFSNSIFGQYLSDMNTCIHCFSFVLLKINLLKKLDKLIKISLETTKKTEKQIFFKEAIFFLQYAVYDKILAV